MKSNLAKTSKPAEGRSQHAAQLQALGLTEYESRALLALIERNPATAYEVSKQAGLPRANVYTVLEGLQKKGAVQPVSENPARYVPVEPTEFLSRIASQTSDLCRNLAESLSALAPPPSGEYVWSLPSMEDVVEKMRDLIDKAKKHVWIKGDIRHIRPCLEALAAAAARKVSIVIVLFGTRADKQALEKQKNIRVYLHEGSGTAVGMSDHLVSMTKDFDAALTASLQTPGYGVYTQNIPVVVLVESLIRHEIYMAEIFEHFGPAIEERFGPSLTSLRRELLPKDQFRLLSRAVQQRH